ncbi:MAG: GspE/PulE family protein [Minisyncoccia bacterium]
MSYIDTLLEQKKATESQIQEAQLKIGSEGINSLDVALVDAGVDPYALRDAKGAYYGIPTKSVELKNITDEILHFIPFESAEHYRIVPIDMKNGILEVGITDPDHTEASNALQFIASKEGFAFKIFLITSEELDLVLKRYNGLSGEVGQALNDFDSIDKELAEATNQVGNDKTVGTDQNKIVEDAPIIKIVAVILRHAIEGDASDIHIENSGEKVLIRFRVDGLLHTSLVLPLNTYNGVVARIKILTKLRLDEKRKPQDGSFSTKIDGRKVDFRVSTFPAVYGEKIVIRILDSEQGVKNLGSIGFSERNIALVKEALKKQYGLILITGPTGSGKSTTLYSMLNELDREKLNVVSLEDPVEFNMPMVNQSQVMPEIGYTFASGLRSILRQDPDIIFVGEIRDKETAQLAIQAALTGHLVLSTLHTNSAAGVVPRLIDMGVDPYLIAPTLILAMAQRLVRHTHPSAKKEVPVLPVISEQYEKYFADLPDQFKKDYPLPDTIIDTVPSPESPTGTKGRIAVHEVFKVDRDMQNLILKTPSDTEIYKLARTKGFVTMREDGFIKSLKGEIPMTEVFNLADDRE